MIIKRNLKSQMPSLKRCKLDISTNEDNKNSTKRKKRKTNGYYQFNLLGEVVSGIRSELQFLMALWLRRELLRLGALKYHVL
ncbi:hypothetical protein Pint_31032 [Pistacia integerrima]|uniref:Uncharacterized protein n=1 Tax=Pistacia integerrima TaxID=434235 RepID=A0ACC0XQ04_9ROSI|nr:hypothetical protein Pint_31032 [Pistacia integerrima]